MLSFLLLLNKKHNRYLSTIMLSVFGMCAGIWGFEVQNLFPSGTLASTEKWQIRIFLTLFTIAGSLLTSLVLTFIFYKKDMEPLTITPAERERYIKLLNIGNSGNALEPNKSTKSDFDAAYERLMRLSKPTEPASASSEPGPDDYHAKRTSFFHSDSDRPKRR